MGQKEEICKCAESFVYFCENYMKLRVLREADTVKKQYEETFIPFRLYGYQERLVEHWEANRFSIMSKFRQGGFTTLLAAYSLWLCLFRLDQKIGYFCQTDRLACEIGDLVKQMIKNLPEWMTEGVMNMTNSHQKKFDDTGSSLMFYKLEAACGQALTLMIIDEASFIDDMEKHWKAMYPILSCGGRAIIQSTPRFTDDWFWDRMLDAKLGIGGWKRFVTHYKDKSEFDKPEWELEMRKNLGEKGWLSEVEQQPAIRQVKEVVETLKKKKKLDKWRTIHDEWSEFSGI
jgi:hypothetical protein